MIEFFWSRDEAEEMLARVLRDEPDWRDWLHVQAIEFIARAIEFIAGAELIPLRPVAAAACITCLRSQGEGSCFRSRPDA